MLGARTLESRVGRAGRVSPETPEPSPAARTHGFPAWSQTQHLMAQPGQAHDNRAALRTAQVRDKSPLTNNHGERLWCPDEKMDGQLPERIPEMLHLINKYQLQREGGWAREQSPGVAFQV